MAEHDFAIVGTDLLAGLLAGVLARDHGKKVMRIGRRRSPQRLWRSLPVALPLATRPASWKMVRESERETRALLGSMGIPDACGEVEAALVADRDESRAALDHLVHVAAGFGHQVRHVEGGWVLRRVAMLDRERLEQRMSEWLRAAGVTMADEGPADAAVTVLADDAAILDGLDEARRPALLIPQAMTTTQIVCPRPLPAGVLRFVDRGVTLVARPGSTVLAFAAGEADVEARLGASLPGPFPMKRLATTRYRSIATSDGAPMFGRPKGTKVFIAAGMGDCAPFFAPALGRLLAGVTDGEEKAWFAAHDASRPRERVADFAAVEGAA